MFHTCSCLAEGNKVCALLSALLRGCRPYRKLVFFTIASGSSVSGSDQQRAHQDSELESQSAVLRWPRTCTHGLKQKRAFIIEWLQRKLFNLGHPFFVGGIPAFNYIASCRCTINEEVLKEFEKSGTKLNRLHHLHDLKPIRATCESLDLGAIGKRKTSSF